MLRLYIQSLDRKVKALHPVRDRKVKVPHLVYKIESLRPTPSHKIEKLRIYIQSQDRKVKAPHPVTR